ncbi:MAG TPA: hypothetical protein VEL76_32390 [Gemmataceae bacterium]|nr:hypothetical protein [Gemmataceae bacterium]
MSAKEQPEGAAAPPKKPSKKDQIVSLWTAGIQEVSDLAHITQSRPSYVASVLQEAGLMTGYFDLYTPSDQPMNVYSKFFTGRLGFRDEATARASLERIDQMHRQFAVAEDRAGQHHCLVMALTMFDRARWTGKGPEAEIFRKWLLERLKEAVSVALPASSPPAPPPTAPAKGRKRAPKAVEK